jgi:hypothetical protein
MQSVQHQLGMPSELAFPALLAMLTPQLSQLLPLPTSFIFQRPMMINIETKSLEIESLVGYTFTDKRIAVEAVQMAAPQIASIYESTKSWVGLNNNKRLALLGNAILSKVLCGAWFEARDPSGNDCPLVQSAAGY